MLVSRSVGSGMTRTRVSIGGRLPHHYFKSVIRTLKATGMPALAPILSGILRSPIIARELALDDRQ